MSEAEVEAKVQAIPDTLIQVFRSAEQQGTHPAAAADRLAESRFRAAA